MMTATVIRRERGPGWGTDWVDITKFGILSMPQLTFTVYLTGLLILMLFMMASIYAEGAPFETPVDKLPTFNDDRLALRHRL